MHNLISNGYIASDGAGLKWRVRGNKTVQKGPSCLLIEHHHPDMTLIADLDAFYRSASYPLVACCDMEAGTRDEASDLCVAAAEKYEDNLEKATQV